MWCVEIAIAGKPAPTGWTAPEKLDTNPTLGGQSRDLCRAVHLIESLCIAGKASEDGCLKGFRTDNRQKQKRPTFR